jgi:carboxyl-terminal processing protease
MSGKAFWRLTAFIIIAGGALMGGLAGGHTSNRLVAGGRATGPAEAVEQSYTEALGVVSEEYAEEIDYEKASQAAIQGMLRALDPHSNYFTPTEYARLMQDQESRYVGIGVSIVRHGDGVYVQTPIPNTPAARAGLRFGDLIAEVDGKDAREWTTAQTARAVRGEPGKPVTLKIERTGAEAPLTYTVVRASVPQPTVRDAYMLRPGTGYVALTGGFTQKTTDELREALQRLGAEGMRQLVLDLRNNPGGLLDQAISVSSLFIERGKTIVSVRGRAGERDRVYKNTTTDPVDYPLVILINRNSASASEIVAGAVQDHGRGLVVGETSFGKGLVQKIFPLPYGAGLTLTTSKYYTPYGRLIQRNYVSGSYYDYVNRQEDEPARPSSPTQAAPLENPLAAPTPVASPTGEAITAAGGRVFYGGGGITPDHTVKPIDVTTPVRGRIFEASFHFTRRLAAGLVEGLESYRVPDEPLYGRYPRANEYAVSDRVLEAFREFLRREPKYLLTPAQADAEAEYVRLRLRDDIITAAYGGDAGTRTLLEADPQLLRALDLFAEAKQLAENVAHAPAN